MKRAHQRFQESYYDHCAYSFSPDERIRKVLEIIPEGSGRLLDIGCSDGSLSRHFLGKGYNVEGVDISGKAVRLARQKGIRARKADFTRRLPYPAGAFDAVFCGEVIEHILHPDVLLHEINRVLRPGGRLFLTTPNISSLRNAVLILFGRMPAYASRYNSPHIRDYNCADVGSLLAHAGFRDIIIAGDKIALPIGKGRAIHLPAFTAQWSDYLIASCTKQRG
ncbi:MAG TPA: class I SAM-dependent methyltransferase [Candidatus Nanoarchaeia archaeon]|nr:class I SAM-dependent methyltransferase [Candidatus Nanoarchaeia archaeon]